jgi:hypothetical protein
LAIEAGQPTRVGIAINADLMQDDVNRAVERAR